ncbi:MAG: hypothetical protein GVY17_07915 [Cyanobacteria bacterium]|nr:hypothetical protein [Cyanobacteria bacterium GSL.Bin21]
MTQLPNFFIVGAPRCGTTALSRYLSQHRQICLSRPKETHFLYNLPEKYSTFPAYVNQYLNKFFCHCRQSHSDWRGISYLSLFRGSPPSHSQN